MAPTTTTDAAGSGEQVRLRAATAGAAGRLSAEDAFDAECSTLPQADREALIKASVIEQHQHHHLQQQQQDHNDHHDHHHHHHHQHHHHHHSHAHADSAELHQLGAHTPILPSAIGTDFAFKRRIVWPNAIGFAVLHALGFWGLVLGAMNVPDWKTSVYCEYI